MKIHLGSPRTREPVHVRTRGRTYRYLAAIVLIGCVTATFQGAPVVATVLLFAAVLLNGEGRELEGWADGRREAGRLLSRVADTAEIPGDAIRIYRAAASIAAGSQA